MKNSLLLFAFIAIIASSFSSPSVEKDKRINKVIHCKVLMYNNGAYDVECPKGANVPSSRIIASKGMK